MKNSNPMGSVKGAALTVLVDNKADLIVESSDQVKYFTDKPLLAEHGFSMRVFRELRCWKISGGWKWISRRSSRSR